MGPSSSKNLKTVLRIDFPDNEKIGRGKMQLLEHIRETGSISAAGRAMDMSYRRAWLLVSAMNAMFSQPVVDFSAAANKAAALWSPNSARNCSAAFVRWKRKSKLQLRQILLGLMPIVAKAGPRYPRPILVRLQSNGLDNRKDQHARPQTKPSAG